jgi:hypothetical protein
MPPHPSAMRLGIPLMARLMASQFAKYVLRVAPRLLHACRICLPS